MRDHRGFSILETIFATGIMATALVALAQMFAIALKTNQDARAGSEATTLARQKVEQLRALTYAVDTIGLPVTDTTTDTAQPIETPSGGTGLSPSPPGTLAANVDGYVDYVDRFGNIIGGGTEPRPRTAYIRRWSIAPLPTNPNGTIVIQVMIARLADRLSADRADAATHLTNRAVLVSMKTRRAP